MYHKAGGRIIAGEELFRPLEDGFYRYKYSPTAAVLFIPLAFFPLHWATIIYWVIQSALVIAGFHLALQTVHPDPGRERPAAINNTIIIAALILATSIWDELSLGQVNLLLLAMLIAVAYLFNRNRPLLLSFIWALSLFIKPYGLIFIPYFLMKRRFRETAWMFVFSLMLFMLPIIFYGSGFFDQQVGWFNELENETAGNHGFAAADEHTIFSLFVRYSPARLLSPGSPVLDAVPYVLLMAIMVLGVMMVHKGRKIINSEAAEFAVMIALLVLILLSTINAYCYVELAVFLVLVNFRLLGVTQKWIALAGFIAVGMNFGNALDFVWPLRLDLPFQSFTWKSAGVILLVAVIMARRYQGKLFQWSVQPELRNQQRSI